MECHSPGEKDTTMTMRRSNEKINDTKEKTRRQEATERRLTEDAKMKRHNDEARRYSDAKINNTKVKTRKQEATEWEDAKMENTEEKTRGREDTDGTDRRR